jgi:hypothetical protein
MKKVAIIFIALSTIACKKEHIQPTYNGDLINIHIESNSSTLYVNNLKYVSDIHKLDTNIRLFAHDTLRIINNSMSDTQHIKCIVNYNKYYSAIYYNNHIYDSVKACPSYSRIIYNDNSLIFTIAYRYKS